MTDSEETNSAGKDIRISEDDAKLIAEQIKKGNIQKSSEVKIAAQEGMDDYVNQIKELTDKNNKLQEDKKQELLGILAPKDKEKYQNKSLEDLTLIVDYLKEHPGKGGIPRFPISTDSQEVKKTPDGRIGSKYDNWGKGKETKKQ